MDRKEILFSVLKEIEKGTQINEEKYDITKEQFGQILELALDNNYIKNCLVTRGGRDNKVLFISSNDSKITLDGLRFIEENSILTKAYKGLKELRDWF